MLVGIDISAAQGTIAWDQAAASGSFNYVFCKATEGGTFVDQQFHTNWAAAQAHGFIRGAYCFARTGVDPVAEADFFCQTVGALSDTDMLVLDIETSPLTGEAFLQWNIAWLQRVEAQTGVTPLIYTGGFFGTQGGTPSAADMAALSHFPLWLAAYVQSPDRWIPPEFKALGWKFWQKSGDVAAPGDTILHVPGIHGNVDKDEWNGSVDDLKAFAASLHQQAAPPSISAPANPGADLDQSP
jgi:lysozyme